MSQIGWEWYSRLAQHAAVTLVTHIRNRSVLDQQPPPASDSQIIYVDTESFAGPLYRFASWLFPRSQHAVFLISSLDFFAFDRKAVRMLKKIKEDGQDWDIVHCVTPVSPIASPTLHRLGAPVILGPWNGGLKSPTNFPEYSKQDSGWLYPIRNLGRFAEIVNRGIAHSAQILTATSATAESISKRYANKTHHMLENGVDLARFSATAWPEPPSPQNPLRVLFVGRLIPFKGVPMLLDAVKNVTASFPCQLAIVGDGPDRALLEHEASERGLSQVVNFRGNLSLNEVSKEMQKAHVFCLPSVRESGGAVLLEAMASNRPVIAVKYGGPGELVSEDVGHAILPLGRQYVVEQLTTDLLSVAQHPELWKSKGLAGRKKAESEFSWDAKVGQALDLYRDLLRQLQPHRELRSRDDHSWTATQHSAMPNGLGIQEPMKKG